MSDSKVYSFSAKSEADKKLIDKIKRDNAKVGKKFSWVVLEALKAHHGVTNGSD